MKITIRAKCFIILFIFSLVKAYPQSEINISLSEVIDILSLNTPAAKIERLNFENKLLQFENYKKEFLPDFSLSLSPLSFNRSIVKLQQAEDGQYNYVEDYSSSSNFGITMQQKVPLTGGIISINSSLNYLNELSQKHQSFSSTPFSINYSQQLFGKGKTMRMEKNIEYQKNEENIKVFCANISNIQKIALSFYLDAFLAELENNISLSNKIATDSLFHLAKSKYQSNRITQSEYNQIELQVMNNEYIRENALKNYEDAIKNLFTYLGLPVTDLYSVNIETPEFTLPLHIDTETVRYYITKNNPVAHNWDIRKMEAQKALYVSELENKFNANINLSYGMNQFADKISEAYSDPSKLQSVAVGLSTPVSLWGVNRNNARIAKNIYQSSMIGIEQEMNEFENAIGEKVNAYNHNVNLWFIAERSYKLAQDQYGLIVQELAMGKSSVYELTASQQEQSSAMQKYYNAIKSVWESYFTLRELTLFDFVKNIELTETFLTD